MPETPRKLDWVDLLAIIVFLAAMWYAYESYKLRLP